MCGSQRKTYTTSAILLPGGSLDHTQQLRGSCLVNFFSHWVISLDVETAVWEMCDVCFTQSSGLVLSWYTKCSLSVRILIFIDLWVTSSRSHRPNQKWEVKTVSTCSEPLNGRTICLCTQTRVFQKPALVVLFCFNLHSVVAAILMSDDWEDFLQRLMTCYSDIEDGNGLLYSSFPSIRFLPRCYILVLRGGDCQTR